MAQSDHQATGVAVTKAGRRFFNFPCLTDDAPVSVAEVIKDGSLKPYTDAKWNSWPNARANAAEADELALWEHRLIDDASGGSAITGEARA